MTKSDDFYNTIADTYNILDDNYSEEDLNNLSIDQRLLKSTGKTHFSTASEIVNAFKINDLVKDQSYLADMTAYDYIIALIAGSAGAFSSSLLENPMKRLHDSGGYTKRDNPKLFRLNQFLSHKGDLNDKVVGLGHRVAYGHDLFNPSEFFECVQDKAQLLSAKGVTYSNLSAVGAILKHMLIADPMSAEGIPIPGHSFFRERVLFFAKHNYSLYKKFFTLKTRDLAGAALTTALCRLYKYHFNITNEHYRYYWINIWAHSIAVSTGVVCGSSFNYFSFIKFLIDFGRLTFFSVKKRGEMQERVEKHLDSVICMAKCNYDFSDNELKLLLED
jgi:hypothetical protein